MEEEKKYIVNALRDTRKDIRYEILADRKLSREEKLYYLRQYNMQPLALKAKRGSIVTIYVDQLSD